MNTHTRNVTGQYAIRVEEFGSTATARYGDHILAQSDRARVMYETRLPPMVYFPVEDLRVPLGAVSDLQTFCPFKGTATYHDIALPGETLKNAAWTYADALPESRDINGFVGFMPGSGVQIDTGGQPLDTDMDGNISGPLVDWLLREAWVCPTPEDLTRALCHKLIENGVALSRVSILIWSLHPQIAGRNYIWEKATDSISTRAPSYEIYDHPGFVNSPLMHVSRGLGGVRQRIRDSVENAFPVIEDLRAAGATDYVAMPLRFSDGQTNVMTLTCDHPDGFTTANLGLIFECSAIISRYFEVFNQRENARALLETYVGTRAGARVLGGDIRRGDGDEIDAAILFCDLRGSTRLEAELGRAPYLELLNRFFETISTHVEAHGGEILKFIGDAVLAVFPAGTDPQAARTQALDAACDIVAGLAQGVDGQDCRCSIGIDYGQVMYGNIGSQERLDFTVIGAAANIAARLGDYGKTVGQQIVVTSDFVPDRAGVQPLGALQLHNVPRPVQGFGIDAALCAQTTTS